MKKHAKTVLCTLAISAGMYAQTIPTTGLVSRWEFNNNYNDGTANNNHLTSTSYPALDFDRCQNANSAVRFNGTSDFLKKVTPTGFPTGANKWSVAFWLKTTSASGPLAMFSYGQSNSSGGCIEINHNYCQTGAGLDISQSAFTHANTCLNDGEWHHLAATYDAASPVFSTVKFYFDGVPQFGTPCLNGISLLDALNIVTGDLFIGTNVTIPHSRYFNGWLDDIYFYNTDLNQADIDGMIRTDCGITSQPCFCNNVNVFYTAPVAGASYNWSLPFPWTIVGSSNSNQITVTAGSGSGNVTCTITTACGGKIIRQLNNYVYCNSNLPNTNVTTSNETFCTNGALCVNLNASSTTPGATFVWSPGGPGATICVSPGSTSSYVVTATAAGYCPATATAVVTVIHECCPDPDPPMPLTPISGNISGPVPPGIYEVTGNLTLTGPGALFANSIFLFRPNIKVVVPAGTVLDISNSHLYACGIKMWDGIEIQDGGKLTHAPHAPCSLIEDAKVAVDLSNVGGSLVVPPIDINNITFNKNNVGIKIATAPGIATIPISVKSCVFTCRALPFNMFSWPCSSTTDLRSVLNPTTGLASPYFVQTHPSTTIKIPFAGNISSLGMSIMDVNDVSAMPTTPGVDMGAMFLNINAQDFNLFDNLGTGIEIKNASFTSMNNVFQNIVGSSSPTGGGGGAGIRHTITGRNDMNARLDLRPIGFLDDSHGNRFWNCHTGIDALNVLEIDVEYGVFRSDRIVSDPITAPGWVGIMAATNRFDYNIRFSQFNNLRNGVYIATQIANYDVGSGQILGIHSDNMDISENYFGAHVLSGTPLSFQEAMHDAITVTGPNSSDYQIVGGAGGYIAANRIDRVFRGVTWQSMYDYPTKISGNDIKIVDDLTFNSIQHGTSAYDTQGYLDISYNQAYSIGTANTNVTLIKCDNNIGGGAMTVNCNNLSSAYAGFEFIGSNPCSWRGNSMTGLVYAYQLSATGVIGTQGSISMGCGNSWVGNTWDTYCNASNSASSILWVNVGIFNPATHGGGTGPYVPGPTGTVRMAKSNRFTCSPTPYPPVPAWRMAAATAIEENQSSGLSIFPNPTTGRLNVAIPSGVESVYARVVDITGKLIFESTLKRTPDGVTIDLPATAAIYFVELRPEGGTTVFEKIIVTE